jgi:hypothetical protein
MVSLLDIFRMNSFFSCFFVFLGLYELGPKTGPVSLKSVKLRFIPQIIKIPEYPHFKAFYTHVLLMVYVAHKKHSKQFQSRIFSYIHISIISSSSYYLSCKGHSIKGLYTPKSPSLSLYHKYPYIAPP